VDTLVDLRRAIPHFRPAVIFDVGANIGQSAKRFRAAYPQVEVFCFEPGKAAYAQLSRVVGNDRRTHCYQTALGSRQGTASLLLEGTPDRFRIEKHAPAGARTETVSIDTLSHVCSRFAIREISYLKIDTEGYDLEVLRGGETLLRERRVQVIEVEAAMGPDNDRHIPYAEFVCYLEMFGYRLFGIYEQVPEWPTGRPQLRRGNLVFISPKLARGGTPD